MMFLHHHASSLRATLPAFRRERSPSSRHGSRQKPLRPILPVDYYYRYAQQRGKMQRATRKYDGLQHAKRLARHAIACVSRVFDQRALLLEERMPRCMILRAMLFYRRYDGAIYYGVFADTSPILRYPGFHQMRHIATMIITHVLSAEYTAHRAICSTRMPC